MPVQLNIDSNTCRITGLDTLRILGSLFVTWQHAASVLGGYETTQWRGISPGQAGVAIFCVISGYLVSQAKNQSAERWLLRRLQTVFPAYWIVTVFAYFLVFIFGSNKPVSLGMFISQMAGLGYLTHGWNIINSTSWFISLILLCYSIAYVVQRLSMKIVFWLLIGMVAACLVITRTEVTLSRHIMGFAIGAAYGYTNNRSAIGITAIALTGLGVFYDPQLFYSGIGLSCLILATRYFKNEPRFVNCVATHSYEYFLLHGIFLIAASKFISNYLLAILVAVMFSILASLVLKRLEIFLTRSFSNPIT